MWDDFCFGGVTELGGICLIWIEKRVVSFVIIFFAAEPLGEP